MSASSPPPMSDIELAFATITEQSEAMHRKQTTSVELTTLYLDRLEKLGPSLGAVAHVTRPLALVQAAQADKERAAGKLRGPLHGIPFGVKDLLATANDPTEWGSPAHKGQVFDYDAFVVERLREAGAVLLGKLAMIELAGGGGYRYGNASSTGPCRTPWNTDHWAGGSSSGPGAATAAGLVGFAIGSETWGSIVCPSSFCGVSGLRPTFGRVSRHGAMALSYTMDKLGPMARSAEDCGLILDAISGQDPQDATTSEHSRFKHGKPRSIKGMRLGVIRPDYHDGDKHGKAQPETETAFEGALGVLTGLGAVLSDAALPNIPMSEAAGTIISVEGAAAFEALVRDQPRLAKLVDNEQQGGLLAGLVIPGVDYLRSQRIRTAGQRAMADFMTHYDALVAPGMLQVSLPLSDSLDDYFVGSDKGLSGMGNLCGLPALCVPMGFGPGHLPLGLQFVGTAYDETTLLSLGMAYQGLTDWHRQRPPGVYGS
jgi:aspartyl-tRNA(Asn)/glutamyl-tRNA(Gln) amidotransferase subunit A